jgi:TIR domain
MGGYMPSVFISYRHEEAADMCGRIADFLDRRFGAGTTFRDVNAILAGSNFVMALQRGLDESRVVLVLIGPRWIHMQEPNGVRRIDSPNDFVRYEIGAALHTGKLVVPVLLDGATMPTAAELPHDLAALAEQTPVVLRNDPYFADDMAKALTAFRSAVAWAPSSVGMLSITVAGVLALAYFSVSAAMASRLPHLGINDFLMFIVPNFALIFAIIRSARTRRWIWLSILLAAGLAALIGGLSSWPYTLYVINLPILLLLIVFALVGPRQPYRSPAKQRPTYRAVFTTFWVALLAFYFAVRVTYSPGGPPFAEIEGEIGLVVAWGVILIGNALGLARAWQTRKWAWFVALAILFIPSFPLFLFGLISFFINVNIGGALAAFITLLILAQITTMGIFSWWGPRALPVRRPAVPVPVAVQQ